MQMADIIAQMGGVLSPAAQGAKAIGDWSLDGPMNPSFGPRATTTPLPFIENFGGERCQRVKPVLNTCALSYFSFLNIGSKNSATNCREFVFNAARSQPACSSVRQKDIVAGVVCSSYYLQVVEI